MADNVLLNPGSGGATIRTDDCSGVEVPITKIGTGAAGTDGGVVTPTNPFPVEVVDGSSHTLPTMDAVARKGFVSVTDGTNTMPTMDVVARKGFVSVTDGTNTMPTMDVAARAGLVKVTDGTNTQPTGDVPARAIVTVGGFPGTFVSGTSTGGAQANSPTLPAVSAKTNYCSGFQVTGLGATAAGSVAVTLSDGTWTLNYTFPVPIGATIGATPLIVKFDPPLPASATDTAIALTVPSFGTGNTAASSNIFGYVK